MSVLDSVTTGTVAKPRRIMLYGVHGIGKTTWAASAPGSIILPTEEGSNDIDCARLPIAETYDQFLSYISGLYGEDHDYKTAIVDSLDWLEKLIWQAVCKSKGVDSIADIDYGKGYAAAMEQWREVLTGLDALRLERGISIIVVAHATITKCRNPETEEYDRFEPKLHKLPNSAIQEWCDEVLFANYKVATVTKKGGFNKETTRGIGKGERVLRTTDRPAHSAKNRLQLPDELPLSWEAFAEHLPNKPF